MRVYSCYFSPNDPLEVFETQILLLEESFSEAAGQTLIRGDFNSKSLEWRKARLDRRRILVGEMAARNNLIVLNQGKDLTFRRGDDCRVPSRLKDRRLFCPRGDNFE